MNLSVNFNRLKNQRDKVVLCKFMHTLVCGCVCMPQEHKIGDYKWFPDLFCFHFKVMFVIALFSLPIEDAEFERFL